MASARLILDSRKSSRNATTGLYPICLKIFHKKSRLIRLPYYTSVPGWDPVNMKLKKSVLVNKELKCDEVNKEIYEKLNSAKSMLHDLGSVLPKVDVDVLIEKIKGDWDKNIVSEIRMNLSPGITLNEWSEVLIERKLKASKPATAKWYKDSITAITQFNKDRPLKMELLTVTFLQEFEMEHRARGNSNNGISSYLRAVRAIYNSAIREDKFEPAKNPFLLYKIPTSRRNKKKALSKEQISAIRGLQYETGSSLWHVKNYLLCMFNCRGMNLIDLAKLRVQDIKGDRIFYGRSKTDDPLSVRITPEFTEIIQPYIRNKNSNDFLFPIGYDGSVAGFKKYRSDRRLINKLLKKIALDAGIDEKITSYYIRHSWATIAKNIGISTEIISEGLGHHSLRTTELYLKAFDSQILDNANDLVVS